MGGTRALLASLGASASLVAGAALSLLAASFVFAYDGIVGSVDASPGRTSLQVSSLTFQERADGGTAGADMTPALVVERPKSAAAKPTAAKSELRVATGGSSKRERAPAAPGMSRLAPPVAAPAPALAPPPKPAAPAKAPTSKTGDGVRKLGDDVGDTVRDTANAVGGVVQPLSPPVSQAVEKVLDVIAAVVQRAVNGLAGALDEVLVR